ncbi:meckelin-like isoform X1 [Chiloscyllium plagiosum]|uniref:meckelin-like isoform X1 n=2 Tax=Chiloscyllium plagiosum TaxID=36176 RepID=UPI001CB81E84|nr:meckelin-like isoform X1 [Chiloscyllium plagiosum]
MLPLLCLAVFLPRLCRPQTTGTSLPFVLPHSCSNSQFYDVSSLQCSQCGAGSTRSADGLRCACKDDYTMVDTGSPKIRCDPCTGKNQVVSVDKKHCLTCMDCQLCPDEEHIRVEDFSNNTASCDTCPKNTTPNALGNMCTRCHETFIQANGGCTCPSSLSKGGLCFKNTELPSQIGSVPDSIWYETHLQASYLACSIYSNQTACQLLTNLVVLSVNTLVDGEAYILYKELKSSTEFLPKLFYVDTNIAASLWQMAPQGLSFTKDSKIALKVVKYDARGNFLGWEDVRGGTLQLCPDTQILLDAAFKFGSSYVQSCKIRIPDLLSRFPEPILYELFLMFNDSQGLQKVWPIPIRNLNLDRNDIREFRRFFLVDGLTGRRSSLSNPPSSVTFAKDIVLRSYLPTRNPTSEPPFLLTVQYAQVRDLHAEAQVTFTTHYEMNYFAHKRDTDIALGVLGSLAVFVAMLETSSWRRRSGLEFIDVVTIVKYFAYFAGALSNAFFVVTFGTGVYWLIVYKGQQSTVEVTLPPAGGKVETDFIIYVACAFGLKALELIHILIVQVTVSIFLIDWEKPKGRPLPKPAANRSVPSSVSIWRTYFIANEWNEIQTKRKINPILQLFAVLLLLEVIGLKNIARRDLNLNLHPEPDVNLAPWSPILRYGIAVSMWLAVGLAQVLFCVGFCERFVEDKIQQFVDLCSVSNVSVLVLLHRCYGYYIHGRSVHGQADIGMESMYLNLKKEEDNLCAMRGLEPNMEVQTFEVLISNKVRQQYDRILSPLNEAARVNRSIREDSATLQQNLKAYYTMNKFLSSFLEHAYKDMDYVVKEKLFLERILDFEFQRSDDRSFFYNDDRILFSNVLYYGHELVLLLFDILLFSVVDLGTQDFVLATIITYLVQKILESIRNTISRRNLAVKTLVDERFLI